MAESATQPRAGGHGGNGAATEQALSADAFTKLLDDQLGLYERLARLVDKQRELVAGEDPTPLLALLAERQQLTERLSAVAERIGPLPERWERFGAELPPERRSHCAKVLGRIQKHLRDIIAADGRDVRRLEVRKKKVARELGGISTHGAMLSAYGKRAPVAANIDRTDETR